MTDNGYTRQSASEITTGSVIKASSFNNEFNQLQAAFDGNTGHDHTGATGMGQVIAPAGGGSPIFLAGTVGGTANAITIATTTPNTFALIDSYVIYFRPVAANTSSVTVNVAGTGNIPLVKISPSGYVNMDAGDLPIGQFTFATYDQANNVFQSVTTLYGAKPVVTASGFTQAFTSLFVPYVMTSAANINLASIITMPKYFWFRVNALGGAVTITPNGTDVIMNGSAGAAYTLPQGTFGTVYIGSDSKWYVDGTGGFGIGTTIQAHSAVLDAIAAGTYTGANSITTLGTIATGTWNASVITGQYGGTGIANTGKTITLGGNVTTGGIFITSGASSLTLTTSGATNVTLPTSGTLVGSADTGTVTNTMLAGSITAAKLVGSDIATVGTITSGTWSGTTIAVTKGGTGLTTLTTGNVILGAGTSTPTFVAPGTSGNVLTSNGSTWTSTALPAAGVTSLTGDSIIFNNSASTGAVTLTLVSAGAGTILGNATSSSAAPTYTSTPQLGKSGTAGSVTMGNATSGLLTLQPATGALGTVTVSIPAATDTLVNLASAQSLSNKTFVAPILGTPASGNLSNCTNAPLPAALAVGSIILGVFNGAKTAGTTTAAANVAQVYIGVSGGTSGGSLTSQTGTDTLAGTWQILSSQGVGNNMNLWQRTA